jgi:prepilin-type N-terminal cleavage/methylation domain-containing protein
MIRNPKGAAGFTLLEVVIASSIFALLICLLMGMLGRAMGSTEMDVRQTLTEDQVQNAVDDIIQDLKETSPAKVTFFQFVDDGRTQTAITFPCARSETNDFVFTVSGQVQYQPVWQCVRVYCFVSEPNMLGGWIKRYDDYSVRSYTNPITVSNITASTITLSDGTTFNRGGPAKADQKIVTVPGRFFQMESAVPADEGPTDFTMDPDLIDFAVVDQEIRPLRLTIRSEVEHQYPGLAGGTVVTTLTNEVLSRNRN